MERARLEQLEEVLVSHQDALDRRESNLHAEADARFVNKRDAMEEEFAQKAKDIHAQERDAYNQKIRAQEARHAHKVRGLKKELDLAKQEAQRLRGERNSAREEADDLREERLPIKSGVGFDMGGGFGVSEPHQNIGDVI